MASLLVALAKGSAGCGWRCLPFPTLAFQPEFSHQKLLTRPSCKQRVYANLSLLCRTGFPLAGLFSQHSCEREAENNKSDRRAFLLQQSISDRHNGAPVVNQWISVPLAIICSRFVSEADEDTRRTKALQLPFPLCLAQRKQAMLNTKWQEQCAPRWRNT